MELAACLRWTSAVAFSNAAPLDRSWRTRRPAMASKSGARIMVVCRLQDMQRKRCSRVSKGTSKKNNGHIFQRWKCFDCQGCGLKNCPSYGK